MPDETQRMMASLIEVGFWKINDIGDPTTDEKALGLLLNRVEEQLAKNVFFIADGHHGKRLDYEIHLAWIEGRCLLATGPTLVEAICNSALALPSFLKEHPQCARK